MSVSPWMALDRAGEARWQDASLASRYPGDVGIERDRRVLFAENFDSDAIADLQARWESVSNADGAVLAFSDDRPAASAGRRSLAMTATLGVNTGGYLYSRLARPVDEVYARFYVKFEPDAPYIHHFVHLGGYRPSTPYPQGGAGQRPKGDDRITVGIEPHGDNGRALPPGLWSFYNYWHEMRMSADSLYWGNAIRPERPAVVPKGRWQCVEIRLKLNTQPDRPDGELDLWLDGDQTMHVASSTRIARWSGLGFLLNAAGEPFDGFRWRRSNDLQINFFWLLHYVTEGVMRQNRVANPKAANRVWFDDIVVATDYVGPIVTPGARSAMAH